ncbi:TRAP transporter substrate-binding protein [Roseinatronobacter sp. S2]|uniref:TRAP transporter substrate-binding protein n=1 Tax=Roseinatronobacter sp. S2 TaxID=3035471 RepID=UPI00358F7E66
MFPSSQLGQLRELAEGVSTGVIALAHNTAGAMGALHPRFAAFDTPYLYRDVEHLMAAMASDSPVMQELNAGLIEAAGVRVLYAYYFGTRNLTANRAVTTPEDLSGVRIRAIPFPIYMAAVEGMGAVPVPVDWAEVPTALATGVVDGQENPLNVVVSHNLQDVQSHLMLTTHITAAQVIIINEDAWQALGEEQQAQVRAAAEQVHERASAALLEAEEGDLQTLRDAGMTAIGPEDGQDVETFRTSVNALAQTRFAEQFGTLYEQIDAIR